MFQLRIGQGFGHGAVGGTGHTCGVQRGFNLRRGEFGGPEFQLIDQLAPVGAAVDIFGEARVGDPVWPAGGGGEVLEGSFAGNGGHDPAGGGGDGAEHRPAGRRHGELRGLHLAERQSEHGFEHGHIDHLAAPGGVALVECGHRGAEGVGAGENVGDVDAAIIRAGAVLLIGEMGEVEARGGVHRRGVGGELGGGAGLAEAGDGGVDQPRIDLLQNIVVQAEAGHDAGPEIFHQHIDLGDQFFDDGNRFRSLQVQHQAALAGVELAVGGAGAVAVGRAVAHQLALGGFDLDHLRTGIAEQAGAIGAGDGGGEVEHAQLGEGTGHMGRSCCLDEAVLDHWRGNWAISAGLAAAGFLRPTAGAARNNPRRFLCARRPAGHRRRCGRCS